MRKAFLAILTNVVILAVSLLVLVQITLIYCLIGALFPGAFPEFTGVGLNMSYKFSFTPVSLATSAFHTLMNTIPFVMDYLVRFQLTFKVECLTTNVTNFGFVVVVVTVSA